MSTPDTRTAIVTGASRGIGLAIARELKADGMYVVGAARTVTPEMEGATDLALAVDLSSPGGAAELVERTLAERSRLDVLVNNAGSFVARTEGFAAIDDDEWLRTLDANLMTAVRTIRAALPSLLESHGTIINVGSARARAPQPPVVDYAAAKAALVNLSRTLADELAPHGVTVNTVSPGPTLTPAWERPDGFGASLAQARGQRLDEFLESFPQAAGLSTGRFTEPEEVAALVALLASGRARNMNGAHLIMDGGQDKSAV
jgi:putative oxidoreductase